MSGVLRRLAWAASLMVLLGSASTLATPPAGASPRLVWRLVEPARGIPAVDGQAVYFLSDRHELVAASVTSGRILWRIATDSTAPTFGSRVIVRGNVVVAGDYDLMGVDRRSGRRIWTLTADDGGAAVHLGESAGDRVFTGSLAGALHAVSMATGHLHWSIRVGDPATTTVYSPVVRDGLVAASYTDFGAAAAGGVVVADVRTGRVHWKRAVPESPGASGNPVIAGPVVLASSRDGTIYAFDTVTGATRWRLPGVEQLHGEPDYRPLAVSGRTLLAGSLSGEVVAHDLVTRRVIWRRAPTIASVAFNIAAAGDVAYVPYFSNQIVALRVEDGAELWRIGGGLSQFRWLPRVAGPLIVASGSHSLSLFHQNGRVRPGRP